MNSNQINWYPGHMKKATDQINQIIKHVDLVIEVLDARATVITSNSDLHKILNNKPVLQIALKSDLANININENNNLLVGSVYNKQFKKVIIDKLYEIFNPKILKYQQKGLVNPEFTIMVVGIPNIGKTSLINFLTPKKTLIAKNMPGVTKKQETRRINQNFIIIDTPGVLFKKITNYEDGLKLSLLNCISKKVLPIEEILKYGFKYWKTYFKQQLDEVIEVDSTITDFYEFTTAVGKRYNLISKNNEVDYDRVYEKLYKIFVIDCPVKINLNKNLDI